MYYPILTNHTSMESLFIQISDDPLIKIDPCDWFCGPGSHIVLILRKVLVKEKFVTLFSLVNCSNT